MEKLKFEDIKHGHIMQSFKDYVIEFPEQEIVIIASQQYPSIFKEVSSKVGVLNFRNFVGVCNFFNKKIQVNSKKISQSDFKLMMIDLVEKMPQLPFDFNAPTLTEFEDKGMDNATILYHLFLVARHFLIEVKNNVSTCIENIISNPSEKMERIYKDVAIWELKHLTTRTINSMITSPHNWLPVTKAHSFSNTALSSSIYNQTGSHSIPGVVEDYHVRRSHDTSENRFIKYFLHLCLDITQRFALKVSVKKNVFNRFELLDQCNQMEGILEGWIQHEFFSLIGDMIELPYNSMVLQKREGYKEIYDFYNRLLSSLEFPLSEEKLEMLIDNKDVAELYEIWTFISMINTIESRFNLLPKKSLVIKTDEYRASISPGICVVYEYKGMDVKLWYNKTFYKGKGSYSLTLRPDIVLEIGKNIYIFDAKFKLESLTWEQSTEDDTEEKSSFTFKNGDIYKMHTYKDAISGAVFACILYPNPEETVPLFFQEEEMGNYGVGAIPLLPGNYLDTLGDFLEERCFNY
ncbi:hypothetical protein IIM_00202 [Bacillus cereus VD107]|nr:hypothetical protein IIM_00202 [Bacillus cereus VD107]